MHHALFDINQWIRLDSSEQDDIVRSVSSAVSDFIEHQCTRSYGVNPRLRVPTFFDSRTGLHLNLVIGGTFDMGLSERELRVAEAIDSRILDISEPMMPSHRVHIRPFLISQKPILESLFLECFEGLGSRMRYQSEQTNHVPVFMLYDELDEIASELGYSVPSEAQIEYAYRAGTNSLFYFGDSLPHWDRWPEILVREFDDESKYLKAANGFGLVGLGVGDWCADSYEPDYAEASNDDNPVSSGPNKVIRGGGAMYWPWQYDNEWFSVISAFRTASTESIDGCWPGRLAVRLPE